MVSVGHARLTTTALHATLGGMPAPPIHDWPLPYAARLDARNALDVDLAVIHCTELPDLAIARRFGEEIRYDSGTGNSGHVYIDREGDIHRFVPETRIAHHVRGYNARSVGIELVNRGRYPHWLDSRHQDMTEPYPEAQIEALLFLLEKLATRLPSLAWIAGHEDLDREQVPASDDPALRVPRKRDPGPQFPWDRVLAHGGLRRLPQDDDRSTA